MELFSVYLAIRHPAGRQQTLRLPSRRSHRVTSRHRLVLRYYPRLGHYHCSHLLDVLPGEGGVDSNGGRGRL